MAVKDNASKDKDKDKDKSITSANDKNRPTIKNWFCLARFYFWVKSVPVAHIQNRKWRDDENYNFLEFDLSL